MATPKERGREALKTQPKRFKLLKELPYMTSKERGRGIQNSDDFGRGGRGSTIS